MGENTMKSNIKVVESNNIQEFTKLVNNYNELFDVFATQTHVTVVHDKTIYTAIIFHRIK